MLMSAEIGKKAYVNFDFLRDNMMVYVCGKFWVCSMFLSDFTKGAESTLQHYPALNRTRVNMISRKIKMSCSMEGGNITM